MGDFRARKRPPPRGEEGAVWRGERPLVEQVELVHAPRLRQSVGAAQVGQLEELADDAPEQRSATAGVHFCRHVVLATRDHHLNAHGLIRHLRRAPCIPAINGRPVEREKFRVNVARGGAGFRCVCHAHDTSGLQPVAQPATQNPPAAAAGGVEGGTSVATAHRVPGTHTQPSGR